MTDIMADIETTGLVAGCRVVSIGAVAFDTASLGPEFYRIISEGSAKSWGLVDDPATLQWWSEQDNAVRATLAQSSDGTGPYVSSLHVALEDFAQYVLSFGDDVRIWGNGADFDNAMLAHAYNVIGDPVPWKHWNNRCFRTLKALDRDTYESFTREGVHHNALDDAKHQARIAGAILAKMLPENDLGWGTK